MTGFEFIQIVLYMGLLIVCTPLLGGYMARVFQGERNLLSFALRPVENGLYRVIGVDTKADHDWKAYAFALVLFNLIGFVFLFALQLVKDIEGAADRLNRPVENLLDMSRLESRRLRLKRDWCDVSEIIGTTIKPFDRCFETHPLTLELAPNLPLIQVNFVLIEQVIVNLLDNACTYTLPGTAIRISARAHNHALEISVHDSGAGIPAEDHDKVFEKFYRVPGTAMGGTGLGLSISRGLIEAHGGTLTLDPDAGMHSGTSGARFILRLPMDSTPPPVKEADV